MKKHHLSFALQVTGGVSAKPPWCPARTNLDSILAQRLPLRPLQVAATARASAGGALGVLLPQQQRHLLSPKARSALDVPRACAKTNYTFINRLKMGGCLSTPAAGAAARDPGLASRQNKSDSARSIAEQGDCSTRSNKSTRSATRFDMATGAVIPDMGVHGKARVGPAVLPADAMKTSMCTAEAPC